MIGFTGNVTADSDFNAVVSVNVAGDSFDRSFTLRVLNSIRVIGIDSDRFVINENDSELIDPEFMPSAADFQAAPAWSLVNTDSRFTLTGANTNAPSLFWDASDNPADSDFSITLSVTDGRTTGTRDFTVNVNNLPGFVNPRIMLGGQEQQILNVQVTNVLSQANLDPAIQITATGVTAGAVPLTVTHTAGTNNIIIVSDSELPDVTIDTDYEYRLSFTDGGVEAATTLIVTSRSNINIVDLDSTSYTVDDDSDVIIDDFRAEGAEAIGVGVIAVSSAGTGAVDIATTTPSGAGLLARTFNSLFAGREIRQLDLIAIRDADGTARNVANNNSGLSSSADYVATVVNNTTVRITGSGLNALPTLSLIHI